MTYQTFLRMWYTETLRRNPLQPGEQHTFEDFCSSPMAQACIATLELNDVNQLSSLTLLEENLKTCLDFMSLPNVPRSVIELALRKVQTMQKEISDDSQ